MARRRTPIFSVVDPQVLSSGLQPDRHSLLKALWETAANVVFWNGMVRRKIPPATAFDTGEVAPIRGLAQQIDTTGSRWIWAGANNKILRWRFGAPVLISGAFGTYVPDATAIDRPTQYDFTPYGDWMIVNDSYPGGHAKIFKPGTPDTFNNYSPLTGVTKFVKALSFVIAVGYGARGAQVGWPDANNIEDWDFTSTTNTAGELAIDEFNTPIRAASKLGQSISCFSEDQMALVGYIGSPFIFGQRTVLDGIGCVGKQAVASDGKVNVGMSRAGAWWTDGNTQRYIDEGYICNYFQDRISWPQAANIVVGRNDYTGCFEFHFPVVNDIHQFEAWSWDPRTGGWSPVAPFTAFDERRLFEHVLYGDGAGKVLLGDFNLSGTGDLVLETKPLVMSTAESPHVVTRVDEIDFLLHEAVNVEWRIGCCDEPGGTYVYSDWSEAFVGMRVNEVPFNSDDGQPLPEQPYWRIGFRTKPGAADWRFDLQGFMLYGAVTGAKM